MYYHLTICEMFIALVTASTTISRKLAILGDSVVLSCSVSHNVTKTTWNRLSTADISLYDGKRFNQRVLNVSKFSIDYNTSAYILMITNISKEEKDVYCCDQLLESDTSVQLCTNVSVVEINDFKRSLLEKDPWMDKDFHDTDEKSMGIILYIVAMFSGILIICVGTAAFVKYRNTNRENKTIKRQTAEMSPIQNNVTSYNYMEIVTINPDRHGSRFIIVDE